MSREAGKGSGRRPSEVSKEVIDANWDRIFGKKNTEAGNQIEEKLDKSASEEIYDPHLTINS